MVREWGWATVRKEWMDAEENGKETGNGKGKGKVESDGIFCGTPPPPPPPPACAQ